MGVDSSGLTILFDVSHGMFWNCCAHNSVRDVVYDCVLAVAILLSHTGRPKGNRIRAQVRLGLTWRGCCGVGTFAWGSPFVHFVFQRTELNAMSLKRLFVMIRTWLQ